ncbi:MAG: ImmA/IrrE family metallo-endopeptidase [Proteobacteria bacterium]|nr:MAG: ImmA/IrrE family metallo-endopeptidase [Pseudomonadota bacterium]
MSDEKFNREDEIARLIHSALNSEDVPDISFLRKKYEERLTELGITANQAEDSLEIEYRTLNGILDGNLKRFDLLSIFKIAYFLDISEKDIIDLYMKFVADRHKAELEQARKVTFILNHFDLDVLKSIGVIDSKKNFKQIEDQLNAMFGLASITDYETDDTGAAHSETKVVPKNGRSRSYFKGKARSIFRLINNPHPFNKQGLIDYFPKIRWHSTDVDNGIVNVIKSLYSLGVTVVFHPKMPQLQLRGATFAVKGKPCIVLTDYMNSYPTLWFALLHELFHVLFDWEEILRKRYHLSDEENDLYVNRPKELEANDFAREYLFPRQKLEVIEKRIQQKVLVREYALDNHVHPSIIYANYAHFQVEGVGFWSGFDKLVKPPMGNLIRSLSNDFTHKETAADFANFYKTAIFNSK